MRLSGDCRWFFFLAWLSWWLGGWCLVGLAYFIRAQFTLAFYAIEAWAAMLTPMAAVMIADIWVMRLYERMWRQFNHEGLGPVVLERESIDRLRADLRRSLLLRWLMPPNPSSLRRQLLIASIWLPALTAPDGTPWRKRYAEMLLDAVCLLLLVVGLAVLIRAPAPFNLYFGLIQCAYGLLVLGWAMLRLAARRQAIVDYFDAWRAPAPDGVPAD